METNTKTVMCANCGMEIEPGMAEASLERDGETFYFCSEGCRDSFAQRSTNETSDGSM